MSQNWRVISENFGVELYLFKQFDSWLPNQEIMINIFYNNKQILSFNLIEDFYLGLKSTNWIL